MKITTHEGFAGLTYQIIISQKDDINAFEIAECFKSQYPKEMASISFARVIQVEVGLLLVGLRLKNKTR